MGCKFAGPAGTSTNQTVIDDGTMCRQASAPPAPIGSYDPAIWAGGANFPWSNKHNGPILVGKSKRDPGRNEDGTVAEDMQYGDAPGKSYSIREHVTFGEDDDELARRLRNLMRSLSMGEMEDVAVEMADRFIEGKGGIYTNRFLDREVMFHRKTLEYQDAFEKQLADALKNNRYNPMQMAPLPMKLLNFSSTWDKIGGLGITVHQVWAVKAELENYEFDYTSRSWWGRLLYSYYDHFGLDWEDIRKHGNDTKPSAKTGAGFKAWYILQHYRKAKPFITMMRVYSPVRGRAVLTGY